MYFLVGLGKLVLNKLMLRQEWPSDSCRPLGSMNWSRMWNGPALGAQADGSGARGPDVQVVQIV